jgi:hypothetical protein
VNQHVVPIPNVMKLHQELGIVIIIANILNQHPIQHLLNQQLNQQHHPTVQALLLANVLVQTHIHALTMTVIQHTVDG